MDTCRHTALLQTWNRSAVVKRRLFGERYQSACVSDWHVSCARIIQYRLYAQFNTVCDGHYFENMSLSDT
jgi:hypothetical protein